IRSLLKTFTSRTDSPTLLSLHKSHSWCGISPPTLKAPTSLHIKDQLEYTHSHILLPEND
ncbi:hypothetical protein J6590_100406, partial [Homalodisca vitripennis]